MTTEKYKKEYYELHQKIGEKWIRVIGKENKSDTVEGAKKIISRLNANLKWQRVGTIFVETNLMPGVYRVVKVIKEEVE